MDTQTKILRALSRSLSKDLKGFNKFLHRLRKEDDWSFIVKSHAYMEFIIANLLLSKIGEPRLNKIFRRIELGDDATGKLAYAKELELLTKKQRRFVRALSTLRNRLVHNVEMLDFSLSSYVNDMDSISKRNWQDDLIWFDLTDQSQKVWREIAIETPKTMLWFSLALFSFLLLPDIKEAQLTNDLHSLANEKGQIVVKELLKSISKPVAGGLTRRSS